MIHVSIPDTQSLVEADGIRKYDAFNVYLNGAFHASIRYSGLLRLHNILSKEFEGRLPTPYFPSKKIKRHLNIKSLNERRLALIRYLQAVVQLPAVACHPIVETFFLDAQIESFRSSSRNVALDIYVSDGSKHSIKCVVENSTENVLELFCRSVDVQEDNICRFGLFLVRNRAHSQTSTSTNELYIVRWLKNYESPYISLHLANQNMTNGLVYRVAVRKIVWDLRIEDQMLTDAGALKLLYAQASTDLTTGSLSVSVDMLQRLRILQQERSLKEFMRLCQLIPTYGYEQLDEACISDYPWPENRCKLRVGRRQIITAYADHITNQPTEAVFKATRIRVWKLVNNQRDVGWDSCTLFQFEYLVAKDHFEWVTLETDQAVMLSLYLQSIGIEILREQGNLANKPATLSASLSHNSKNQSNGESQVIYESFRDVFEKNAEYQANEAFNNITDDDL